MDEKEIKEIFGRLRAAAENGDEPSKDDMLRIAEGALINLATLAAHTRRKNKG
jgi:hypothetical protein